MRVVLTPTGARPEAFALCEKYLYRQELKEPILWVVVDDGPEPQALTEAPPLIERLVIRPTPLWSPDGPVTQQRNMQVGMEAALDRYGYDAQIVFWEDDDHYEPAYLETIFDHLPGKDLIGESHARYYNVRGRRYQFKNNGEHASLRSSAIAADGIKHIIDLLKRPAKYYDLQLWRRKMRKKLYRWNLTTGIKGMPGRDGIAPGHDATRGVSDPVLRVLTNWIGQDADAYRDFYKETTIMTNQPERRQMVALKSFPYAEMGYVEEGDIFEVRDNSEVALFIRCERARPALPDEIANGESNAPAKRRRRKKKVATKQVSTPKVPVVENNDPVVETKDVEGAATEVATGDNTETQDND